MPIKWLNEGTHFSKKETWDNPRRAFRVFGFMALPAAERGGNNLKRVKDFYLEDEKARSRLWTWRLVFSLSLSLYYSQA